MNKDFALRGLLVFALALPIPAFAEGAAALHLVAPKVGNMCTYRMTDQLFHKGELIHVLKMTVESIVGDEVYWRTEVIERGPSGPLPLGFVFKQQRNASGYTNGGGRTYTPYSPILGKTATNGPEVAPKADLGKVAYTWLQRRNGASGTTTVTGEVSDWEDVIVPAGKFHILRLTWGGTHQINGDSQNPRGASGNVSSSYVVSGDTPCIISESTKWDINMYMGSGEATLMELVTQDTN
jgi:hypothetical protein